MLITYISQTGNIRRFVKKIPFISIEIKDENMIITEPCVFITYTTGIGQEPLLADSFCLKNHKNILALASSGNKNWGTAYGAAADILSDKYGIPILMKFELSGRKQEVDNFIEEVNKLEIYRTK